MGSAVRGGAPSPLATLFGARACATQKSKNELYGLVQGILADGIVVEAEAAFLLDWISKHETLKAQWPCNVLYRRLEAMLADRLLDAEEQRELLARLCDYMAVREQASNANLQQIVTSSKNVTVDSPFDDPVPPIEYMGRIFVVTGDFASCPRKQVVSEIESRGGSVNNSVSKKVNFLIVGELGSEHWAHGNFGTKIDAAVSLRRGGAPVCIVPEKAWFETLRL